MESELSYPGAAFRGKNQQRLTYKELLDICLRNAANSFTLLALEGETKGNQGSSSGKTMTLPSWDRFSGNVMILYIHVPDEWRVKPDKYGKSLVDYKQEPGKVEDKIDVIYHAILERLRTEGHFVEGKVQREVVGKPTALTAEA